MSDERKGFIDDATEVLINEIMPLAVKSLLDKIPEDQYERIFQEKKKYWNMVLPFFSLAVLRVVNKSEIIEELSTRFFAELRREINYRAGKSLITEIPERIDVIAEMAKYPSLLKKLNDLDNKERGAMLAHLSKIPLNQSRDHLQMISKMADPDFQLYVKVVSYKAEEQLSAKAKKIGKDAWETLKKWREEDKKKSFTDTFKAGMMRRQEIREGKKAEEGKSLSEAFEAGKNWRRENKRQAIVGLGSPAKPKNWFVRHRYKTVMMIAVLSIILIIIIKAITE